MPSMRTWLGVVVLALVHASASAEVILLDRGRGIGGSTDLIRWNCASPFVCVDYTQHPFGVNAPDNAPWIESQDDFVEIAELGAFAHNFGTQDSVIDLAALIFGGEGSAGSETAASDSTVFPWGHGIAGAGSGYSVTLKLIRFNYQFNIQTLLEGTQSGVFGNSWAGVSLARQSQPAGLLVDELIHISVAGSANCGPCNTTGNDSRTVAASGILTPGIYQFTLFAQTGGGNRPDWGLVFDDNVTSTAKWNGQLTLTQGDRAVPEPGLMALAATALAGLWVRRRAGLRVRASKR
jgi:PEP-CTERM motif-containing protein